MTRINLRFLSIGIAMLAAAGLALAITPRDKIADNGPKIDLETMIPRNFGEWNEDVSIVPIKVSPDVQAKLDKIYNQTLSRTYINDQGQRIMLSIAYGSDQSDTMAVHKPEVCYPSQGFNIIKIENKKIEIGGKIINAKQLVAKQGRRNEPITYWINIGNTTVSGGLDRKIAQLKYSMTGSVPDGMLVRVSNISDNASTSFQVHREYLNQMFENISQEGKERIFGANKS